MGCGAERQCMVKKAEAFSDKYNGDHTLIFNVGDNYSFCTMGCRYSNLGCLANDLAVYFCREEEKFYVFPYFKSVYKNGLSLEHFTDYTDSNKAGKAYDKMQQKFNTLAFAKPDIKIDSVTAIFMKASFLQNTAKNNTIKGFFDPNRSGSNCLLGIVNQTHQNFEHAVNDKDKEGFSAAAAAVAELKVREEKLTLSKFVGDKGELKVPVLHVEERTKTCGAKLCTINDISTSKYIKFLDGCNVEIGATYDYDYHHKGNNFSEKCNIPTVIRALNYLKIIHPDETSSIWNICDEKITWLTRKLNRDDEQEEFSQGVDDIL
eukprot:Pgem_evm1s3091